MGQHKHNPTAIAAAKGELPPKPKKMGKRESERLLYAKCQEILYGGLVKAMVKAHKENEQ
jgi:hypothetical protein